MKRYLLINILFLCLSGYGQKVKITEMNRGYFKYPSVEGFFYLHHQALPETYDWVADAVIELDTILPNTLKETYDKMEEKGNKLGANAFRISDSDIYAYGSNKYIRLSFYYLRKENRDANKALFERPVVYLFGFLGYHQDIQGYNIAVNREKMILEELRYKIIEPGVGNVVHVKLGKGFKANEVKTTVEAATLPRYYTFSMYRGFFSAGVISEHEWSFGEMLIQILKPERIVL